MCLCQDSSNATLQKRKHLTVPNAGKDEEQLEPSDIRKTKHIGIMAFKKSMPVEKSKAKGEKWRNILKTLGQHPKKERVK